jgi:hypothetical protein
MKDETAKWLNPNFAYLIASGSPSHRRPNGSASEIRSTPHARKAQETVNLS